MSDPLDLSDSDGHSPQRLLELAERIAAGGYCPEHLQEIEQAGATLTIEDGAIVNPAHISERMFTITVSIRGRRTDTIVSRDVDSAVAHGLRCAVIRPPIRDGQELRI